MILPVSAKVYLAYEIHALKFQVTLYFAHETAPTMHSSRFFLIVVVLISSFKVYYKKREATLILANCSRIEINFCVKSRVFPLHKQVNFIIQTVFHYAQ